MEPWTSGVRCPDLIGKDTQTQAQNRRHDV